MRNPTQKPLFSSALATKLVEEKEPEGNRIIANTLLAFAILYLVILVLFILGVFSGDITYAIWVIVINEVLLGISILLYKLYNGKKSWLKYVLLIVLMISVFCLNFFSGFKLWLLYAIPMVVAGRYIDFKILTAIYIMAIIEMVVSAFFNVYVVKDFSYMDVNYVAFNEPIELYVNKWLQPAVSAVEIDEKETLKSMFGLCILPNVAIVTIYYVIAVSLVYYAFSLVTSVSELSKIDAKAQIELNQQKAKVMVSQIQPHFLYNTLNSIYYLVDEDPEKAKKAIDSFSKYLRYNMKSIASEAPINFEEELQHTASYIWIEQMRFEDRINVEYNIKTTDFKIPPLTIQPLVENAIKHGILETKENGTVKISTSEKDEVITIVVEDDGSGFDYEEYKKKLERGEMHIGVESVKSRVEHICHGKFDIESKIGQGTKITITLYNRDAVLDKGE
jgi:hypothetical protein